jgi:hypothetical protein
LPRPPSRGRGSGVDHHVARPHAAMGNAVTVQVRETSRRTGGDRAAQAPCQQ